MASKAQDVEAEVLSADEYAAYQKRKLETEDRSIEDSLNEALDAAHQASEPLSSFFGQEVGDRIKEGSANGKKLVDSASILVRASTEAFKKVREKTGGVLEIPRTVRKL